MPAARLRRAARWLADAIRHAGPVIGASRGAGHGEMSRGHDQYVGTALGIDEARRRGSEGEPAPESDQRPPDR
jgi:hypothetical protein